ncbi:MAG TPA: cytochrome c [Terriglobales bacterium]|nr:cytochrome c [Terriglobales bacterium]
MNFRIGVNAALAFLLVVVAGVSWFLRADATRPNAEFLPDMAHSARYNGYSGNSNYPDGKTLQPPPEGAIARGNLPLRYTASAQDAARAGEELLSPLAENANTLQRGAFVFANYCTACHGTDAKGMGPVAQRGYPPPPSLLADHARKMKDGQMFHVLTFGQNNMPSYAGQLSRDDRWMAIVYIRSLQRQTPPDALAAVPVNSPGGVR